MNAECYNQHPQNPIVDNLITRHRESDVCFRAQTENALAHLYKRICLISNDYPVYGKFRFSVANDSSVEHGFSIVRNRFITYRQAIRATPPPQGRSELENCASAACEGAAVARHLERRYNRSRLAR